MFENQKKCMFSEINLLVLELLQLSSFYTRVLELNLGSSFNTNGLNITIPLSHFYWTYFTIVDTMEWVDNVVLCQIWCLQSL